VNYARIAVFVFGISLVSSCGTMISEMSGIPVVNPFDEAQIAQHTTVSYDPHEDIVTVKGPIIYVQNNIFGPTYFLRAWGSRGSSGSVNLTSCQLYVHATFDDWAFLDRAYSQGTSYDVTQIDSKVGSCSSYGGCSVSEDIGVNLPIAECKERGESSGFDVKVSGSGGSLVVDVPASYFRVVIDTATSNEI